MTYINYSMPLTTYYFFMVVNQQELNLRKWILAQGWNEINHVCLTIDKRVTIISNNILIPALKIDGSWPNGLTIINRGNIFGKDAPNTTETTRQNGGHAIETSVDISLKQDYDDVKEQHCIIAGGLGSDYTTHEFYETTNTIIGGNAGNAIKILSGSVKFINNSISNPTIGIRGLVSH